MPRVTVTRYQPKQAPEVTSLGDMNNFQANQVEGKEIIAFKDLHGQIYQYNRYSDSDAQGVFTRATLTQGKFRTVVEFRY